MIKIEGTGVNSAKALFDIGGQRADIILNRCSALQQHSLFHFISRSAYVEPTNEEGFSEIIRVQFKPKFKNERTKELYNQFL